jgi:hypothetical protein
MLQPRLIFLASSLCACLLATPAEAIPTALQDFEDGSTQGWTVGGFFPIGSHPAPPTVMSGGPGGATDKYLQLTAVGGSGPGSKLSAHNAGAWSGNFAAAGLTTIGMDLRNFGATDLYIRLVLEDLTDLANPHYSITDAVFLPVGSGWISGSFSVDVPDLIQLQGDIGALLQSVTRMRIVGNGDPNALFTPFSQPSVTALLGVDNIRPNVFGGPGGGNGGHGVPEPPSSWLLPLGLLAALRRMQAIRKR